MWRVYPKVRGVGIEHRFTSKISVNEFDVRIKSSIIREVNRSFMNTVRVKVKIKSSIILL